MGIGNVDSCSYSRLEGGRPCSRHLVFSKVVEESRAMTKRVGQEQECVNAASFLASIAAATYRYVYMFSLSSSFGLSNKFISHMSIIIIMRGVVLVTVWRKVYGCAPKASAARREDPVHHSLQCYDTPSQSFPAFAGWQKTPVRQTDRRTTRSAPTNERYRQIDAGQTIPAIFPSDNMSATVVE
jgi:hypothetical protein